MWEIGGSTGPRAPVVAEAVTAASGALINLNRAAEAWKAVLRRLTGGPVTNFKPMTVRDVVAQVNVSDLILQHDSSETHFILRIIGDGDAKSR